MRGFRSQLGWAVGISLACHAILGSVLFLAFSGGHFCRLAAEAPIDTRIALVEDYQPITVVFDEPAPRVQAPSPPITSAVIPKVESVAEGPKKLDPTPSAPRAPSTAINSPPNPGVQGNGSGTALVQPLHGPFTRAGLSIVYVLDRSGSMGPGKKLAHAVAILKASLQKLGPEVRFQIVTYDSQATVFRLAGNLELVLASKQNILDAENMLDELVAEGSSRHAEGLRAGLGLHPDLLILLTDAGDLSADDAKQIKQWNFKKTTIHAVLIGSAANENVESLRNLAGKGNVHFVP